MKAKADAHTQTKRVVKLTFEADSAADELLLSYLFAVFQHDNSESIQVHQKDGKVFVWEPKTSDAGLHDV